MLQGGLIFAFALGARAQQYGYPPPPSYGEGSSTTTSSPLGYGVTTSSLVPSIGTSSSTTLRVPANDTVTFINSQGQTIISQSSGFLTVPTGLSSATTITSQGQTFTFVPNQPGSSNTTSTFNDLSSSSTTAVPSDVPTSSSTRTAGPSTNVSGSSSSSLSGSATPTTSSPGAPEPSTSSPVPNNPTSGSTVTASTTVNSNGQTVIFNTNGAVILPTGLSSATTLTASNGRTFTFDPSSGPDPTTALPSAGTTTNNEGQTVISNTQGVVTIPTGISSSTTIIGEGGQIITFDPSPGPSSIATSSDAGTPTNSDGQTVISNTQGVVTIPTGISSLTTITDEGGQIVTFDPSTSNITDIPSPSIITTTNSDGVTLISNSGEVFTIPTAVSTPITITNGDGLQVTFTPSSASTTVLPTEPSSAVTTTDSAGLTVISQSNGAVTLPSGITTPFTSVSGSVTFTFVPSSIPSNSTSSTPSQGTTTTSSTDGSVTSSSTSITTPIVTTDENGHTTTIDPGVTSPPITSGPTTSTTGGFIEPVTTSVDEPQATDDGSIIPCDLWFFNICIRWDDFNILGWEIDLPPGIYPPGPPPPFSINPSATFSISISGTLPDWPEFTIGPDRIPTFSAEPTECQTETAELCATRTSYGVSLSEAATVTTGSQVLSTCATVFGCNVEDSAATTTTTTTGGCTSASTVTNVFLSCPASATGTASCSTTSTSAVSGCSVTPTTVTCGLLTPTGIIQDPACQENSTSYIVYPNDGNNAAQVDDIGSKLSAYVSEPGLLYASNTETLGLNYWRLPLTESQAFEVSNITDVASIVEDCGNSCANDPNTARVYQSGIERQLSYISWPPYLPAGPVLNDVYYFDDSAGGAISVYVVDTGANMGHPEFDRIRDRTRWIQVGQGDQAGENDCKSHGTSMLSLVAGTTVGVAKNVHPINVRMPCRGASVSFSPADWLDGLGMVNDELDGSTPTVVLMASYWRPDRDFEGLDRLETFIGFERRHKALLDAMAAKGAVLVTGTGNENQGTVNGWPASFGKANDPYYVPSLLVMGGISGDATARNGNYDVAGGLPHAYAPGLSIQAADSNPDFWENFPLKSTSGTSCSAAFTAGLAAYFLRLSQLGLLIDDNGQTVGTSPQAIHDYIIGQAWSRRDVDGAPRPGIWNGADVRLQTCPWNPDRPLVRRQETTATCRVPLPSSTSSSSMVSSTTSSSADLPTLTDLPSLTTGIVTPSGSSCASTAPVTQCNGSGGQSVCVTTSSCASWVNTNTPSTTTEPTTTTDTPTPTESTAPLYTSPTVCNNEDDFPGHADVSGDAQQRFGETFCEDNNVDMYPGDDAIVRIRQDNDDINYEYRIEFKPDCVPEGYDHQNTYSPQMDGAGITCTIVMEQAYSDCNNGGVGGYIDVGCLRYTFIGAR